MFRDVFLIWYVSYTVWATDRATLDKFHGLSSLSVIEQRGSNKILKVNHAQDSKQNNAYNVGLHKDYKFLVVVPKCCLSVVSFL